MAKKCILDTNFIIICVKQKIDFFEELKFMGFQILIPEQVIRELEKIKKSKQKLHTRQAAELSLKILEKNKFQKIDIGKGYVDKKILKFVKENPKTFVATIDRGLKNKLPGRKIVITQKKNLEII